MTEELRRAASGSQEVEDQQERLKVDQKRLDLQLAQAQKGEAGLMWHVKCNVYTHLKLSSVCCKPGTTLYISCMPTLDCVL